MADQRPSEASLTGDEMCIYGRCIKRRAEGSTFCAHHLTNRPGVIRQEQRTNEATPSAPELTAEQEKNAAMYQTLALIHGWNEMATKAVTLGEKAFYRLARDAAEKRYNEMGGKIDRGVPHAPVLIIPGSVPEIRFDERDIELMRACVARHDGEQRLDKATPAWPAMPAWDGADDDKSLPEDEQIDAVHPATCENPRHDFYAEAMRLVGARRSKGGLVALVNWLLHRIENARQAERQDIIDRLRKRASSLRDFANTCPKSEGAFRSLKTAEEFGRLANVLAERRKR